MLGLGGGILLTPVFLYLPELFGMDGLEVKQVTGLTMVHGFVAAPSGLSRHRSFGFVSWRLVRYMGVSVGAASFVGALTSRFVPGTSILAVFGTMALLAAALVFLPGREEQRDVSDPGQFSFDVRLAVVLGSVVGFAAGLVGQAGSFMLIPVMVYVLRVPTRLAIGSNMGIILFSATAGLVGKVGASQVPLFLSLALAGGAVPGAQLGALASRRTPPLALRYLLAVVVAGAAIGVWVDAFV